MPEKETFSSAPVHDERHELEELRAQAAKKQAEVAKNEEWGKYDVTVPNAGEITYQEYLAQRPSDGVVRDGEGGFINTATGETATEDDYSTQLSAESTDEYYARKGNITNESEYTPPELDKMGLMELANEAAKAIALGDKSHEDDVRRAVMKYTTQESRKDQSVNASDRTKNRDQDIENFWARVNHIIDKKARKAEASQGESEADSSTPPEAGSDRDSSDAEKSERANAGDVVKYNGEKMTIGEVFEDSSGKRVFELTDTNGQKHLVREEGVLLQESESAADTSEDEPVQVPAAEESGSAEGEAESNNDESEDDEPPLSMPPPPPTPNRGLPIDPTGREVVLWDGAHKEVVPMSPEQEKSRWEKIKAGFKFERDMLRKYGAMAYFSEKWDRVMRGLKDHTLDHGITEEMSDEEKEKKRKRNRVVLIAGGAAVAALGVVAAMHGFDHSSAAPGTEAFQSGHTGVTGAEAHVSGIGISDFGDIPSGNKAHTEVAGIGLSDFGGSEGHVGTSTESTLAYPPLSETSASVGVDALSSTYENVKDIYNISKGMGGIELFDRLGIGGDKWVQNAQTLLSRFPNDFYVVDGDVRIAHSGWLSQDAQNYIESLR